MKGYTSFVIGATILIILILPGCQKKDKLFTSIPFELSNVDFSNTIIESEEFNINEYMYAHDGGGVALGDVNNDGLVDIFFTANQLPNRLFLNKGEFKFQDITKEAGLEGLVGPEYWTTGVSMVDVNQDGWLDIYVNQVANFKNFTGQNQLYINNGNGTFTDRAAEFNLDLSTFSQQSVYFDFDLDGDLDMYQLNHSLHELDVFVKADKRTVRDSLAGDMLFRNDDGFFTDVSEEAGIYGSATGYGLSIAVGDLDNNGCPDIFVSNDFHENDFIYFNQCDGTFKEGVKESLGHTSTFSMGSDVADINNDGWLDLMTLDMKPDNEVLRKSLAGPDPFEIHNYKLSYGYHYQYPRNMLQINRGKLFDTIVQFSEVGQLAGVAATDWSWSVLLQDFDNDGWKDIFITNGIVRSPIDLDYLEFIRHERVTKGMSSLQLTEMMPEGKAKNYAFKNHGKLVFENVSEQWGLDMEGCSMGSAYADLDNDGDLDLVVNNLNSICSIYRNNTELIGENKYLKVSLNGNQKNRFGIGARVQVRVNELVMIQELQPVRGWLSSSDFKLLFGLGEVDNISEVKVTWYDGKEETKRDIKSNQEIIFSYRDATVNTSEDSSIPPLFEKINSENSISFIHEENNFNGFEKERLLPHLLSREGPKLAIADINGDGLDDIYIGGASGQSAGLIIQKIIDGNIVFEEIECEVFKEDALKEDVDAEFFDADQDGDFDLYVVSGGGQFTAKDKNQDRLYLNEGKGAFTKSQKIPNINSNGSCVVAADFNRDNLIDLFVGSRSVISSYGISPESSILWNRGQGKFLKDSSDNSSILQNLGMVTDAAWNEKTKELIVVGEWMPITFLKFQKELISKKEIPNSSGWWNVIYANDLDGDGVDEYLIGNLGNNTELKTSVHQPVRLIIKDWDNNGQMDPLVTHFRQDKEWLIHGLDELLKQMPLIKNRYQSHRIYASHTLQQIFSEDDLRSAQIKEAVTFNSVILRNQGSGKYLMDKLPMELQLTPIHSFLVDDFNGDGIKDILAVGNSYDFAPWIGRLDASFGELLIGNENGSYKYLEPRVSGFKIDGEARDIKTLTTNDEKWVIVSKNNNSLSLFRKMKN